ncbi:MAG TPA: hypothetical protein VK586_27765, partial [Streptosporangiaceae bacterium]|nr:hypothetical protein [Streptosporangiaceae bacterium]
RASRRLSRRKQAASGRDHAGKRRRGRREWQKGTLVRLRREMPALPTPPAPCALELGPIGGGLTGRLSL